MLEISKSALVKINEVIDTPENSDKNLRIYFQGISWGGPSLGMALDQKKEEDDILKISGLDIIIDAQTKDILRNYGGASLDYIKRKFFGSGFSLRLKDASEC